MSKEKRTILIIDDSPDDLEFYSQLLRRSNGAYNYSVLTAESAEEGIEIFQVHTVDCTFVDYNMPENDGLSVIETLRKSSNSAHVPMVILTGEPHQSVQAEAARQGALDYILKDSVNSSETLERVIDKVINWSEALNSGEVNVS